LGERVILSVTVMNKYELAIVVDGESTPAKKKAVIANVEKVVNVNKGKILGTDDWGKKDMAYKIGKSTTGIYLIFTLELEPAAVKELPAKLKLEPEILRYLLIRKDEKNGKKSK